MPTEDRLLRGDTANLKVIEAILKSDLLLSEISAIIAEKVDKKLEVLVKKYEDKITQLEKKLDEANETIDRLEQYGRRNNIRFYGVPESKNENTIETIINICNEKLQTNITKNMIDCCHRLGKPDSGTKPIIVRFVNRYTKENLFKNKSKLKGTHIVLREDLTRRNIQLMKAARNKFGTVWSNNGIIFTKVGSKIFKLNTFSDLNSISNAK